MDKIHFIISTHFTYYKGDIDLALEELNLTNEEVDWDKTMEVYKKKIHDRIEWFKSEYAWNWFLDSIKKEVNENE